MTAGGVGSEHVIRLASGQAVVICPIGGSMPRYWREFFDEHGQETMERAYGWSEPPAALRHGETALVFFFLVPGTMKLGEWFGWATLIRDVRDGSYQDIAIGVRPKFSGRGLRRVLLAYGSDWAFANNGAEFVTAGVYDENAREAQRYYRDAEGGFPFKLSGRCMLNIPDETYSTFTRRKLVEPEVETGPVMDES